MVTLQPKSYALDLKSVQKELRQKFETLNRTDWSQHQYNKTQRPRKRDVTLYIQSFNSSRVPSSQRSKDYPSVPREDMTISLNTLRATSRKKERRNQSTIQQGLQVKLKRREHLKRMKNPLDLVRQVIQREEYEPTEEQTIMTEAFLKKHPIIFHHIKNQHLDEALQLAYEILSMAIDYNSMRYFCLILEFVAQICLEMQNYSTSVYFFEQLRIACTYCRNRSLKINALIGLARNATKIQMYKQAHILLKKALQYAWLEHNDDKQLHIYDMMGLNYFYMGNLKKAEYFHGRFMLGAVEQPDSATKRISFQILNEYHQHLNIIETKSITPLFIEFLKVPIFGLNQLPCFSQKVYENYDDEDRSPRYGRSINNFDISSYEADQIILKILKQNREFASEIPNPTLRDITQTHPYQKVKKTRIKERDAFERSQFYMDKFKKKLDYDHDLTNVRLYKYPLQNIIVNRLKKNVDEKWWQRMIINVTSQKQELHTRVRDPILNSHMKRVDQPKNRAMQTRLSYITQNFNSTLIDFMDPLY